MSRMVDCYDNTIVESFWRKFNSEMAYHRWFALNYIEVFYSRVRLHAALGYQSTEQFEASRSG